MVFENPTRNKNNVWLESEVKDEIEEESHLYQGNKFEVDNLTNVIGGPEPMDPTEVVSNDKFLYLSSRENQFPDIDSFTGEGVLQRYIEDSEVTRIGWGFEELSGNLVPRSGKVTVETRSAQGEDAYQLWIPFVDASHGVVAGFVEPPYGTPETFKHSPGERPRVDAEFFEDEVLDMAYMAAQELVPDVEADFLDRHDPAWFKTRMGDGMIELFQDIESGLGVNSDFSSKGGVNDQTHYGSARGGYAIDEFRKTVRKARERRIIDYTLDTDNKENNVKVRGGGYKTITKDAEQLDRYDSPMDVIETRLTQG